MKFVRMAGLGLLYFCVATVLAQAVVVEMLWWKGAFSDDRAVAMFAALHGIHPKSPGAAAVASEDDAKEQPSLEEISRKRLLAGLDLSLREVALDKSLVDLRMLEAQIVTENERLKQWQEGMDQRIARAENSVLESSLRELQQTLEAISPKQAKEQILKILETTPDGDDTRAMNDVVRILKAMPLDKRKKILGEFKSVPESEKLADILREIRLSPVEMDMLRDSRNQLEGTKR
jgi:hypothetical protein